MAARLIFVVSLASLVSICKSQAGSSGGAGAGSGTGAGASPNTPLYCTPYEWQTNPQECFQRASLYTYNFANSFPTYTPPQYFDNSYLQNWRSNFDNWQRSFQTQVQQNLLQMQQRFAEFEAQLRAQEEYNRMHGGGGGGGGNGNRNFHSFQSQSSNFNGDSGGNSETVMSSSNNDGSWTIRANGVGISSISNGNQITISVYIGDAESYDSKIISDKELRLEVFKKNDPAKRWMSLKITAGDLRVQDFQISRPQADTLLVQSITPGAGVALPAQTG